VSWLQSGRKFDTTQVLHFRRKCVALETETTSIMEPTSLEVGTSVTAPEPLVTSDMSLLASETTTEAKFESTQTQEETTPLTTTLPPTTTESTTTSTSTSTTTPTVKQLIKCDFTNK
jgi:hypothetical protein